TRTGFVTVRTSAVTENRALLVRTPSARLGGLPSDHCRRSAAVWRAWPREESNLRTQIRSLPLYPLSYGAGPTECASRLGTGIAVRPWWRASRLGNPA